MIIKYISKQGQNCTLKTTIDRGADFLAIMIMNDMNIVKVEI